MTGAIVTIVIILAVFIVLGFTIGALECSLRREQRTWDWPEDEWPSLGGWADREKL